MRKISLIAAMAANRAIGIGGRLPWRLPADLKRFKALTLGHTLVIGRKTHESIGRPLPGRRTIVISRQEGYAAPGVEVAHSVDGALAMADGEEIFIGGGEEIFRQTLDQADRIYLTRIEQDFPGDTFFPEIDESVWQVVEREDCPATEEAPFAYTFLTLQRALAVLAVLAALTACGGSPLQEDRRSTETIRKATVYLIADPAAEGCGGSAAPYEVELGSPSPALGGAIEALLALRDRSDSSGLYNALAHSPLKLQKMERSGGDVRLFLTGYLELQGECDAPRVLSQLTETATQFGDIESVELFLDGKPLKDLLSGQG